MEEIGSIPEPAFVAVQSTAITAADLRCGIAIHRVLADGMVERIEPSDFFIDPKSEEAA